MAGTMIPVKADNMHQNKIVLLQVSDQMTGTDYILQAIDISATEKNFGETFTTAAGGYRESDILKCYGSDIESYNETNINIDSPSQIGRYCNINTDMRLNEETRDNINAIVVDYPLILLYNHDQNRKNLTLRSRRIQPDRRV